jgi:hypothetical protein
MNDEYKRNIFKLGERMWDRNKKNMLSGPVKVDKASYVLGYLHGYENCFETYELEELEDIIKQCSKAIKEKNIEGVE